MSRPLSQETLDALRTLALDATPHPWQVTEGVAVVSADTATRQSGVRCVATQTATLNGGGADKAYRDVTATALFTSLDDAVLWTGARAAILTLLDEVDRLHARAERYRAWAEEATVPASLSITLTDDPLF